MDRATWHHSKVYRKNLPLGTRGGGAVEGPMMRRRLALTFAVLLLPSCKDDELDVSDDGEPAGAGEPCEPVPPAAVGDEDGEPESPCVDGFLCEPTDDGYLCASPIELHGLVIDGLTSAPIEGAVVAALDETGVPIGDAARSDATGHYVLRVTARRDPAGLLASNVRWTLFAAAPDYAVFPGGLRPSFPVDATMPIEMTDDDEHVYDVIENATTTVALLPAADDRRGGATITGRVEGVAPGGTLVVAEGGPVPAPYTIADASGSFVLFNVPTAAGSVRGYRQGVELAPAAVDTSADRTDVLIAVVNEDIDTMAVVDGSIQLVNAGGGSATSVVLVPTSLFDLALERGPVPRGLRAPTPPEVPSISGGFAIAGVPSGDYQVLVAFENDGLVRDPDSGIAGTDIQAITVPTSGTASVPESFKVTGALAVLGPGVEVPEVVTTPPMLRWADDSSEDRYELRVFDALGTIVWEDLAVPGQSGGSAVEVAYGGPALQAGMYYQFRATSIRETANKTSPISRTEDLRGVFVFMP